MSPKDNLLRLILEDQLDYDSRVFLGDVLIEEGLAGELLQELGNFVFCPELSYLTKSGKLLEIGCVQRPCCYRCQDFGFAPPADVSLCGKWFCKSCLDLLVFNLRLSDVESYREFNRVFAHVLGFLQGGR